jgi:hypothetical protein
MTRLPADIRYQRTHEFVARTIAGETVLVPIRRQIGDLESIYTLNAVATFIWERLTEPATTEQLSQALEATFTGEPAEIRTDLDEFLRELLDLGAVKRVDGPPATQHPASPH